MYSTQESAGSPRNKPRQVVSLRLPTQPNWRLQVAREILGLSLPQLSVAAGIPSMQTVYDVENGVRRATDTTKGRIVAALNDRLATASVPRRRRLFEAINADPQAEELVSTDLWPSPLVATR